MVRRYSQRSHQVRSGRVSVSIVSCSTASSPMWAPRMPTLAEQIARARACWSTLLGASVGLASAARSRPVVRPLRASVIVLAIGRRRAGRAARPRDRHVTAAARPGSGAARAVLRVIRRVDERRACEPVIRRVERPLIRSSTVDSVFGALGGSLAARCRRSSRRPVPLFRHGHRRSWPS